MCQEPWKVPRIQCCGSSAIQNQVCRLVSDHLVETLGQLLYITTCPLLPLTFSLTSWTCKEFLWFWIGHKAQWMLLLRTHHVFVKTAFCPVPHPLTNSLWGADCYLPCVTEEETEAQRGEAYCPRSQGLKELLDKAPLYKLLHGGYPGLSQVEKLFGTPASVCSVVQGV